MARTETVEFTNMCMILYYIPAPKVGFGGKILPICLISSCLWICVMRSEFSQKKI